MDPANGHDIDTLLCAWLSVREAFVSDNGGELDYKVKLKHRAQNTGNDHSKPPPPTTRPLGNQRDLSLQVDAEVVGKGK